MEIKTRTMLGQAIDAFKEYIETQGNLETDYHLEMYMQVVLDYINDLEVENQRLQQENEQLNDKTSKIETLIINHNSDTGDIYYKYNGEFLKSELKQKILEIVYESKVGDNNVKD